ncbi:MAG: rhomboid family intramembrane serine protease, partial [Pseudomonadota bacterium]|nr:rhomboid family intramembrane serine protease [Pseudomonadota bacterium]
MRPPQSWQTARVTLAIAAVTAAAWLVVALLGLEVDAAVAAGFIPLRAGLSDTAPMLPFWLTPLTATLVHAGFAHLALNLLI